METAFKNKVAIITGGSSGIGRATASFSPKKGAKIVIVDWHESPETMQSLTDLDAEAILLNAMSRKVPM
jgi:NAD(P)-dependent dehydrogenase (short-subunit alcohol dehydrogenase family)